MDHIAGVLSKLIEELKGETPERIKVIDYYADPLDYGYIGIQVETLLPFSIRDQRRLIRTEIQVHTKESLEARTNAHRYYEELRSLKRDTILNGETYKAYLKSRIASIEIFVTAFRAILKKYGHSPDE